MYFIIIFRKKSKTVQHLQQVVELEIHLDVSSAHLAISFERKRFTFVNLEKEQRKYYSEREKCMWV